MENNNNFILFNCRCLRSPAQVSGLLGRKIHRRLPSASAGPRALRDARSEKTSVVNCVEFGIHERIIPYPQEVSLKGS